MSRQTQDTTEKKEKTTTTKSSKIDRNREHNEFWLTEKSKSLSKQRAGFYPHDDKVCSFVYEMSGFFKRQGLAKSPAHGCLNCNAGVSFCEVRDALLMAGLVAYVSDKPKFSD